jgi:hypothetical protein
MFLTTSQRTNKNRIASTSSCKTRLKNHTATNAAGKARIEKAKKLKDEGNKNIGSNVQAAIKCYQDAIFYCPEPQKELIVSIV